MRRSQSLAAGSIIAAWNERCGSQNASPRTSPNVARTIPSSSAISASVRCGADSAASSGSTVMRSR